MKYLMIILFSILICSAQGQQMNGIIEFERKTNWIDIMSKLPFMTQEEIDRNMLTWGKDDGYRNKYNLHISGNKTAYIMKEEVNEYGYYGGQDDFIMIRDYENKTIQDRVDLLRRTYLIEGEAPRIKWKILNEIKEVAGYLCMKAETGDPTNGGTIHAWFTDQIPVFGGPEGIYGLPGMILSLEYNGGDVMVIAKKVTLSEEPVTLPIPKKMKGKRVTLEEYYALRKKHYDQSIEGRQNPYWNMRY